MSIESYIHQVKTAKESILSRINSIPDIAIILGSGLSGFEKNLKDPVEIASGQIPNYPVSTAPSHSGKWSFGTLHDKNVLCISGRLHYYEGLSMNEVTFPIRLLGVLGIKKLIITNAAGGTNSDYEAGDFVFIRDHINLFPDNPLRGKNIETWGPRFPDMSEAYNRVWLSNAESVCTSLAKPFKSGIYVGLPGPNLETPAEYAFINSIGGDLVGMSSVPEVIVARHMNIDILGISLVTNTCYPPERVRETTVEDVLAMATSKSSEFRELVSALVAESI